MKTPRDVLLSGHRSVVPKLDRLRRVVVAEHVGRLEVEEMEGPTGVWECLWRELFWSCRRVWMGLAAGWVAVLALTLATERISSPSARREKPVLPGAVLRSVLQEQGQWRAELLGRDLQDAGVRRERSGLGPRSQWPWGMGARWGCEV